MFVMYFVDAHNKINISNFSFVRNRIDCVDIVTIKVGAFYGNNKINILRAVKDDGDRNNNLFWKMHIANSLFLNSHYCYS